MSVRTFEQDGVRGFLHQPDPDVRGGIALTHGAGGDCEARLLVAIAETFCRYGWLALRYDLAFRRARRNGPPSRFSAEADQESIRNAIAQLRRLIDGRVVGAGHSYGGRQTTMLAAKEPALCDAIIAFSYPLHPPDKPNQLRTTHFADLSIPTLFVHGTGDPFGSTQEMTAAIDAIPARTQLVTIEGAGHDLKGGKFDVGGLVIRNLALLWGSNS